MTELIKINDGEKPTVNARDLWTYLESKQQFADWIKGRIEKYGFVENDDYVIHKVMNNPSGGRPFEEYHLSIDMAKELGMVENNEKGRMARKYFIEVEKRFKKELRNLSRLEILQIAIESEKERLRLEQVVEEAKPKVEFYDAVTGSKDAIDMGSVAKVINMGIGRTKLYALLRNEKILMDNNVPYQEYIDSGYFRVIEQKFQKPDGDVCIYLKTVVYQRGVDYIRKTVAKAKQAS